ncbi:MAG: lysophospholipid acyltransferase family protein [Woeseiaceae bacterium]|nr:lysophospholipid acyltransferase family protein [Woeseiaceae bacterium]
MSNSTRTDYSSVESRRSRASRRRMSAGRRLYYALGLPLLRGLLWLLTRSYRWQPVIGAAHFEPFIDESRVCAPSYWHQVHVLCSTQMRQWIRRGFRACFLISGSVDGEVPDRIARSWGAEVIRGSANQSGALALRDMQGMMKRGYSIVTTADGPRGPKYQFKTGAVVMARIAGIPIVPMAAAADRAWYLDRWDDFMIPKPFARVVVAVGAPIDVPRDVPLDELEPLREHVQQAVRSLMSDCEQAVKRD